MPCGVEPVDRVHHADPERRLDLAGLARGQERVEPVGADKPVTSCDLHVYVDEAAEPVSS